MNCFSISIGLYQNLVELRCLFVYFKSAQIFLLRVCHLLTAATGSRQHIFNVLQYGDVICTVCCLGGHAADGVAVNTADVGRVSQCNSSATLVPNLQRVPLV